MTGNWIFNLDARIDEILYFIWDPIGVNDEPDARAEYLSYVPQFSYLLTNNASKEDIVNLLVRIERDDIGLPTNKARAVIVADLLIGVKNAIDETEEFKTFAGEIDYLIDFFKRFSELIFYNGRIISFFTDKNIFNLSTDLIDSSAQTLRSIKLCCSIGSFSDANTLIRKLRDDLIQYVYILSIISDRKPFIEEDVKNLKTDNPEEFVKSFSDIRINNDLTDNEMALSAWFSNTVSDLKRPIRRKLEFENYMKTLKQNPSIEKVLEEYKLQDYWEILRRRLNDYVHNNGVKFAAQNSIRKNDKNLEIHLKNINIRTSYISTFFIIVLLMVDSTLISSTDYIDDLDCNLEPPEDSQYSIASFIQDFIDSKVNKLHPELKQYLKDNNINGMRIE